jgi:hypothetical protein
MQISDHVLRVHPTKLTRPVKSNGNLAAMKGGLG